MAEWHLSELENEIQQIGWKIISRQEGDGIRISASWVIKRGSVQQIDFNGLDDLKVLPLKKSYGCEVKNSDISVYFYKKGKQWEKNLATFISSLNKLK